MTSKQHVDFYRKLKPRRALLRQAVPKKPVYVPFIGDGDIAAALYRDRDIFGADLDADRIATAAGRLPGAILTRHDCDKWPFADQPTPPFAVADFDAYSYPYESFRAFWRQAKKITPLTLFFTDGQRQAIHRGMKFRYPDGSPGATANTAERTRLDRFYFKRYVEPWFRDAIGADGWAIRSTRFYLRGANMCYWGAVIYAKRHGRQRAIIAP